MILFISICIVLIYSILIGGFALGFDKVKDFKLESSSPKTKFSIIIPFRNEAKNLIDLLESISGLNYPKHLYEIILVDDASEDTSVDLILEFIKNSDLDFKVIANKRLTNSPKKHAITKAISISKYEWIITSDADCKLPKNWLGIFDVFILKTDAKCIVSPVSYSIKSSIIETFQLMNILSLQGATIGGFGIGKPFLCNGANFAYRKKLFYELNGFKGNTNIASGDDIFLLEKAVKAYRKEVHYLKCEEAIVTTKPESTWSGLISQHIRWAGKSSAYSNWFIKLLGVIVLLMNGLLLTTFLLSLLQLFSFKSFIYILIIKFSIDFLLIFKTASFFRQKQYLKYFPISFLIYPLFTVYIAFISVFQDYKWKGRTHRK